jgi:hypothetical protein
MVAMGAEAVFVVVFVGSDIVRIYLDRVREEQTTTNAKTKYRGSSLRSE